MGFFTPAVALESLVVSRYGLALMTLSAVVSLLPLGRVLERAGRARADSDVAYFHSLMYAGEFIIKMTTAALVAGVDDDRDRDRYQCLHRLVRADGIGEWGDVLDRVLTGPPAQHLLPAARTQQRQLVVLAGTGSWQHQAVGLLLECLRDCSASKEPLPPKVDLKRFANLFAQLRNKTRGHGAVADQVLARTCPKLEQALALLVGNLDILGREWAHLHRNLSGKYRVTRLGATSGVFDPLRSSTAVTLPDGVYIAFDRPCRIDLVHTTPELEDFFIANGAFKGTQHEFLSYATGATHHESTAPYALPPGRLPESETHPLPTLEAQGNVFGNLPRQQTDYVTRAALELDLERVLSDDRHPIVTLTGRGGIGKTSLALASLHRIAGGDRFDAMLWFSARDIDLKAEGAKPVKPQVLRVEDMAAEFRSLVPPSSAADSSADPVEYFAGSLASWPHGRLLIALDNFETVSQPTDIYKWLDVHIRPPNKILITTRHRDFKGDYPIEVQGMSDSECDALVTAAASRLGIQGLLTEEYRQQIIRESAGHPYVIKVLLGEIAKSRRVTKVERIVAEQDQMLVALFERTYAVLSPTAQRVFLTLVGWRSIVPVLALEAVLLRPENERMDVAGGIDELNRSSFLEIAEGPDGVLYACVPLVAELFGRPKISVSPMRAAIDADLAILRRFGPTQKSDLWRGLGQSVERYAKHVAEHFTDRERELAPHLTILECVARAYPRAWVYIAGIHEEAGGAQGSTRAAEAIRRYLEAVPADIAAWRRLAALSRSLQDYRGELQAWVEISESGESVYGDVSHAANLFNNFMFEGRGQFTGDERRVLAERLIRVMERRVAEADATDLSRLAWLCNHVRDERRARAHATRGLELDADNPYCLKLIERLRFA